ESEYELGPNYVMWGYNYPIMTQPEAWFHQIMYGRHSPNLAPGELNPVPGEAVIEAAVIDATTGSFKFGWRKTTWPELEAPLSSGADATSSPVIPSTQPSNLAPFAAAAASASLLVLLAVYLYPVLQQGAVGLYTKLVKNQLLDHALRDQLIALIRENPGISPPALKHLTDAGWSTIIYHLSVLRDNNLVTSVRQGRHRRYFLVGAMNQSQLAEAALLKNERTRQVFELVRAQPGCDRSTLARLTGLAVTPVVWHLERLSSHNLIRGEKRGRTVAYFPSRIETPREVGALTAVHV
ncbi:MAG TPA: hypothetical protein VGB18_07605, partial [Candidatus Thermoplasmatota archaeon]